MRLGGRGVALSCTGRKRVFLSIHGDAGSGWRHSGVVKALGQQQHSVFAVDVAESPTVQGIGKSSSCAVPMYYCVLTRDPVLQVISNFAKLPLRQPAKLPYTQPPPIIFKRIAQN